MIILLVAPETLIMTEFLLAICTLMALCIMVLGQVVKPGRIGNETLLADAALVGGALAVYNNEMLAQGFR